MLPNTGNTNMTARQVFDSLDKSGPPETLAQGESAKVPGEYAWSESYALDAYVAMYEASGDTQYLDKFVGRYRVLLTLRDDHTNSRDELNGRIMAAWGTTGYSKGRRTCWLVHAGMLTYSAARFARLVKERKILHDRFETAAAEFSAATEETIAAYEPDWRDGPNPDEGYYVAKSLDGKHLPLNQQNALGRTLLDLAASTGKTVYRERATKLAAFLKRRLRPRNDGAYDWAYWPPVQPPYGQGSEDISHAAINVDFAVRCFQDNIVFTREDIQRLATTFLRVVSKGNNRFADTVGGDPGDKYTAQIGRWANLATVDSKVAEVIRDYFRDHKADPNLKTDMLTFATLAKYGF